MTIEELQAKFQSIVDEQSAKLEPLRHAFERINVDRVAGNVTLTWWCGHSVTVAWSDRTGEPFPQVEMKCQRCAQGGLP